MAKSNKRRTAPTATENKPMIGHNMPPADAVAIPNDVHVPNLDELGTLFVTEEKTEAARDEQRGKRNIGVLLFAIKNPENVGVWAEHYAIVNPDDGVVKTDKEKRDARDWFATMFRIPKEEDLDSEADRSAIIKRVLDNVRFVVTLNANDYLSAFSFNKNGAVFIDRNSPLGVAIWDKKDWKNDKQLVKEDPAQIAIVDRKSQARKGTAKLAWPELHRVVLNDASSGGIEKKKTVGTGAPTPTVQTMSSANPAKAIVDAVKMRLDNPPQGVNKFNECKDMIMQGCALISLALVDIPEAEDERKAFQAFAVMINRKLGITPKANGNGKGEPASVAA